MDDLRPERVDRLRVQADLQVQARLQSAERPPFVLVEPGEDPVWGHGVEQIPEPDLADIFLDFESHPFWRPDRGLKSRPDCAQQGTDLGTGLRWLQVDHTGCSTESVEEAEAVAWQIRALLGRNWTDKHGDEHVIGVDDVMVVAPYNDQVRLLRDQLDADPDTRGMSVGTVDKFQGRQAPVVLFTLTSSSAADMPRGTEFLSSKNRLKVAISRAQCLAYLVCTESLLHSRANTVEDMYLIATLCAFVEHAER